MYFVNKTSKYGLEHPKKLKIGQKKPFTATFSLTSTFLGGIINTKNTEVRYELP